MFVRVVSVKEKWCGVHSHLVMPLRADPGVCKNWMVWGIISATQKGALVVMISCIFGMV